MSDTKLPPTRIWLAWTDVNGHQRLVESSNFDSGDIEYVRADLPAQVSPGFADAVQCVEKLRDEWNQEAWSANRMFSDKANVATQILAALKALPQPAVADVAAKIAADAVDNLRPRLNALNETVAALKSLTPETSVPKMGSESIAPKVFQELDMTWLCMALDYQNAAKRFREHGDRERASIEDAKAEMLAWCAREMIAVAKAYRPATPPESPRVPEGEQAPLVCVDCLHDQLTWFQRYDAGLCGHCGHACTKFAPSEQPYDMKGKQ